MESCTFCGNSNIKETVTDYTYKDNHNYMIINNVPCYKCEYCGENYFESKILKQIEKEYIAIQNGKKPIQEISVPVEDFRQLNVA